MSAPVPPPQTEPVGNNAQPKRRPRSVGRPREEIAPEKVEKVNRLQEELECEERRRAEEAHFKKQDDLQRKRELALMKRKLQSEIRRTASEVKMRESQAAELKRSVTKLEKEEESVIGRKNRRHDKYNETFSKVRSKEADKKTQLFDKLKESGESRERFLRLESALRNLAQNLPALGYDDPSSAADARRVRVDALQVEGEDLKRETLALEEEHGLLQEELERAKKELEETLAPHALGEHDSEDVVKVVPTMHIPMLTAQAELPPPGSFALAAASSRGTSLVAQQPQPVDVAARLRALVDKAGANDSGMPAVYLPPSGSLNGIQPSSGARGLSSSRSAPGASSCTSAATSGPAILSSQLLVRQGGSTGGVTRLTTPTRQMSPSSMLHGCASQTSAPRSVRSLTPSQTIPSRQMPGVYVQPSQMVRGSMPHPDYQRGAMPGGQAQLGGGGALCHSARSLPNTSNGALGASTRSLPNAKRGSITDALFDMLDQDHDGIVSRAEFRAALKGEGMRQVLAPGPGLLGAGAPLNGQPTTARF